MSKICQEMPGGQYNQRVELYTILVFWIPSIFQNLGKIFNISNRYSETDLISERERVLEDQASLID